MAELNLRDTIKDEYDENIEFEIQENEVYLKDGSHHFSAPISFFEELHSKIQSLKAARDTYQRSIDCGE